VSPNAAHSLPMLTSGSGEFIGTSMASIPASTRAAAMSTISSGLTPRRMATIGGVLKL
jgi:hypothetical protein